MPRGCASEFSIQQPRCHEQRVYSSYSKLRQCYNDDNCLNYNTFNSILSSEIDAVYYVSETAFLEFYCNFGKDCELQFFEGRQVPIVSVLVYD